MAAQFPPATLLAIAADSAGRTSGNYYSLGVGVEKAWLVAEVNQGNASTVLLSVLQALDKVGTSSKAIGSTMTIWADQDTQTSDAFVSQTAGATFTTSAALKDKTVIFEIVPERDCDMVNGFYHIGISTGASSASNITGAKIYIQRAYQTASPPTALV